MPKVTLGFAGDGADASSMASALAGISDPTDLVEIEGISAGFWDTGTANWNMPNANAQEAHVYAAPGKSVNEYLAANPGDDFRTASEQTMRIGSQQVYGWKVLFEGMSSNTNNSFGNPFRTRNAAADLEVRGWIVVDSGIHFRFDNSSAKTHVESCASIGSNSGNSACLTTNSNTNNTWRNVSVSDAAGAGFNFEGFGEMFVDGCKAANCAGGAFNATNQTITGDFNMSDDGTAPGANSWPNETAAAMFAGTEDLRWGTATPTDFEGDDTPWPFDIEGTARPGGGADQVGCHQAGGAPPPVEVNPDGAEGLGEAAAPSLDLSVPPSGAEGLGEGSSPALDLAAAPAGSEGLGEAGDPDTQLLQVLAPAGAAGIGEAGDPDLDTASVIAPAGAQGNGEAGAPQLALEALPAGAAGLGEAGTGSFDFAGAVAGAQGLGLAGDPDLDLGVTLTPAGAAGQGEAGPPNLALEALPAGGTGLGEAGDPQAIQDTEKNPAGAEGLGQAGAPFLEVGLIVVPGGAEGIGQGTAPQLRLDAANAPAGGEGLGFATRARYDLAEAAPGVEGIGEAGDAPATQAQEVYPLGAQGLGQGTAPVLFLQAFLQPDGALGIGLAGVASRFTVAQFSVRLDETMVEMLTEQLRETLEESGGGVELQEFKPL